VTVKTRSDKIPGYQPEEDIDGYGGKDLQNMKVIMPWLKPKCEIKH